MDGDACICGGTFHTIPSGLTSVPADAAALLAVDDRVGFQIGRCKGGTAELNYEVDIYEQ